MRRRAHGPDREINVIDELVVIGDQLEAATHALSQLVEELRADLPEDGVTPTGR